MPTHDDYTGIRFAEESPFRLNTRRGDAKKPKRIHTTQNMKHRLILTVAAVGAFALAGLSANANTSVGAATVTIGGGGTFADYTYPIFTANTTLNTTDPSFININDFGLGVVQANTVPGTWSFTQPLLGPNSGNLGVDNPGVADAVFTLTGGAGAIPDGTYSITIRTLLTGAGGVSQWTTSDRQTGGIAAGQPSAAQGFVRSPVAASVSVPDGGTTVALLGFALAGVAGLRRKVAA
jgi:hypothetical protein